MDQSTSHHVFEWRPDGGRIVLERDVPDSAGAATIRAHLRDVAQRLARGDFSLSETVHARRAIPGSDVMRARRARITYTVRDRARGAELLLVTADAEAVRAIHRFLAFQQAEHRSGGTAPLEHRH